MKIEFVPCEEDHLEQVILIEQEWNPTAWSKQAFRAEIENINSLFFVAVKDSHVLGYGCMRIVFDEAHLSTLAVASEYRGQGLGEEILLFLLELEIGRAHV